jgi:superfamily II DNA helicase RecQ
MTRDAFEEVLGALARSGLVRLASAVFEKDGQSIPYRKASLTNAGESLEADEQLEFQMKAATESAARKRKGRKTAKKKRARREKTAPPAKKPSAPVAAAAASRLEDALRHWRLAEAKRRGVPAFRIWTDATLKAISERRPSTAAELLAVPGIGIKAVETYGAAIYRLVAESAGRE